MRKSRKLIAAVIGISTLVLAGLAANDAFHPNMLQSESGIEKDSVQTTLPPKEQQKSQTESQQPSQVQPTQETKQTSQQPTENKQSRQVKPTPQAAPKPASAAKSAPNPASASASTTTYPKQVMEVLQIVNAERTKNGLSLLTIDPLLQKAAMTKATDMRDNHYFSHQSPTYGSPFELMARVGIRYSAAGENIAAGQKTAQDVMKSWMNSPGHRANILNKKFTKIGIGFVTGGDYGTYWTQEFIAP